MMFKKHDYEFVSFFLHTHFNLHSKICACFDIEKRLILSTDLNIQVIIIFLWIHNFGTSLNMTNTSNLKVLVNEQ